MNVLDVKLRHKSRGTIEVARDWLDDFGQVALATVVSTWGSGPVPIGGELVVAAGSRLEGSVSGGRAARGPAGEGRLVEPAAVQAFLHALVPPVRLVLVGATHIGQVLADIAQ